MKKYLHIFLFIALTIVILPFFSRGYFFLLDNPFTSYIDVSWNSFTSSNLFFFLAPIKFIGYIIPMWILQRIMYFAIIFFLGYAGYILLKEKTKIGAYFAGIFAICNPYVYARILDGQVGVVGSIIMTIFFYHFLFISEEKQQRKNIIISSIFGALAVMLMPHSIFFIGGSLFIFFLGKILSSKEYAIYIRQFIVSLCIIFVINSNWIIGSLSGKGDIVGTINQISTDHLRVFETTGGNTNVYFNTLSLHGFWGEGQGRYMPNYSSNEYWYILFFILLVIITIGIYDRITRKEEKLKTYTFLTLGVVSYILALGISHENIFSPLSQFLYDYIPMYIGLRDSQKWAGILLIVYIYFSGYGVQKISTFSVIKNGYPMITLGAILLLPIYYTQTMLFGFHGQLFVSDYPKEWYELQGKFSEKNEKKYTGESINECAYKKTSQTKDCYDILVFPWHQYIGLSFTRKIIANPVKDFFNTESILQGDNMEIGNIYTQSTKKESKIIEKHIGPSGSFTSGVNNENSQEFIKDLKGLGIKKILLLKEADFSKYENWTKELIDMGKIKIIEENSKFTLFQIVS